MRVSFAYSAVCAYNFGDRKGNGYNKMLAELNIKISLHGEFSNQQKNESGEKCDKIDLSIIKNPRIWYSFKSKTEHEFTDRLHKHEYKRHRLDNEDSNAFMKRAINTCKELVGYLNTVYCRIDADKQLNVVKEVILQDKVRSRIRKNGCHKSYPFVTPSGLKINVSNRQRYSMDLTTETFSMLEPEESLDSAATLPVAKAIKRKRPGMMIEKISI